MEKELDKAAIVGSIEQQQKKLNMTRQDLTAITDIPYATLTSCIQKNKLLRFNDLYLISLAIGMPIDELLSPSKHIKGSTNNILYWQKYMSEGVSRRYLLRFPDKVAISKTIASLSKDINLFTFFLPPKEITKSIEDFKATIFFHTLCMDDIFSIFHFADMVNKINDFYSITSDEPLVIIDYFLANSQMAASLWGYPFLAVQNLWRSIDDIVSEKYVTLSAFLKDAGINSLTYSKYLNACSSHASPETETVWRVCSLLGIDDIDGAIRSKLPEIPSQSSNPYQKVGLIPHTVEDPSLKENLKSLPYLAMFFDSLFSLSYNVLSDIYYKIQRVDSSKIKSTEALRRLPFPDNAYSIGSDTLNAVIAKDYKSNI